MNYFSFDQWLQEGGATNLKNFSLSQSYQRISWVYSCINITSTTAASAPLTFYNGYQQDASTRITDPEDPVMQLFNSPSPPNIPSLRELMYRTFIYQGTLGGVYWVFKRSGGQLTEVMPKIGLTPILSKAAEPKLLGWEEQLASGLKKRYTVRQVLPILLFNPNDEYTGLSPLSAARLSVETEFNIAGWNSAFFKGGMKNPMLIQAKGTMTKTQKKDIKTEIQTYYSGIEGGNGAMLLQGNLEVTPLKISPKDVDFVQGKKLNREEICAIYGVPPALVGIFEYSNYANTKEQRKIFWENTLLPKMERIADLIQTNILDIDFPGVTCAWDTSNMPGLQNDPADVAAAAETYYDMGYSRQQISVILNTPELDPLVNPDTSGEGGKPAEPVAAPVVVEEEEDPKDPKKTALMHPSNFEDFNAWAKDYSNIEATSTLNLVATTGTKLNVFIQELLKASSSKTINESRWKDVWEDTVGRSLKRAGKEGITSAVQTMKTISEEGTITPIDDISKYLPIEHQKTLNGQIYEYVKSTTPVFNKIFDLVVSKKITELKEFILNINTLAETLVLGIVETLKYKTYQLLGVSTCSWVARDERHLALSGKQVNLGKERFPGVNALHPHDLTMHLHDVVGCTCTLVPVLFPSLINEG